MAPKFTALPSFRRQHLLAEFSGLKQACPEGVFMTLTPGDPALWSGVIFVRKGPYASSILHFQISFPDTYPSLPPLVTFSTDMFHPLVTPLTNFMYTTDIHDNGTVSATDEERLPPGGFSLRHGFPAWFGRGARSSNHNRRSSSQQQQQQTNTAWPQTPPRATGSTSDSVLSTPESNVSPRGRSGGQLASNDGKDSREGIPPYMQTHTESHAADPDVSTYDVLHYLLRSFDSEDVLDAIPLEAAGNPGAWHAWRAHRQQQISEKQKTVRDGSGGSGSGGTDKAKDDRGGATVSRTPGEWTWEGVWEERVKKSISMSLSDPVLFGSAGAADDVIRFLSMEDDDVATLKENLKRTLGVSSV